MGLGSKNGGVRAGSVIKWSGTVGQSSEGAGWLVIDEVDRTSVRDFFFFCRGGRRGLDPKAPPNYLILLILHTSAEIKKH